MWTACIASAEPDAKDEPLVVVSAAGSNELITYSIEDEQLVRRHSCETSGRPASTCFRHDGRVLYCVLRDTEKLASFTVLPGGRLELQSEVSVGFPGSYLTCSHDDRFLLASSYRNGLVAVFRLADNGAIETNAVQTLETAANAHSVVFDQSGQFVFASHTRPNSIFQYQFDSETGLLTPSTPAVVQRAEQTGPRHLKFGLGNHFAYGSDEQGSSLSVYRFNEAAGVLSHQDAVSSLVTEYEGKNTTSHVEVHPHGNAAYIANRGDNSIIVYSIDRTDGDARLVQRVSVDPVPRSFAVSTDGEFLIVAGQKSNRLHLFGINARGWLAEKPSAETGTTPWWVTCSPPTTHRKTENSRP